MKARLHFQRVRDLAASPLIQVRDRFLFRDHRSWTRPSRWPIRPPTQPPNGNPFFIIGSPRSGTTLLRAILAQHPALFIPPENGALGVMIRTFAAHRSHPWEAVIASVLEVFRQGYEFHHWNVDVAAIQRAAEAVPQGERSLVGLLDLIYHQYGTRHFPGKTRWGDKTVPGNVVYLGKIDLVFPQARYIHIVRDGRDCVASAVNVGMFHKDFLYAAYGWKDTVRRCRRLAPRLRAQGRFLEVRYEDLIVSPESVVSGLCRFLGLQPTDAMLRYSGRTEHLPDVRVIAHHQKVGRPISRDSIGNWRHLIPEPVLPSVLRILRKELAAWGYE